MHNIEKHNHNNTISVFWIEKPVKNDIFQSNKHTKNFTCKQQKLVLNSTSFKVQTTTYKNPTPETCDAQKRFQKPLIIPADEIGLSKKWEI